MAKKTIGAGLIIGTIIVVLFLIFGGFLIVNKDKDACVDPTTGKFCTDKDFEKILKQYVSTVKTIADGNEGNADQIFRQCNLQSNCQGLLGSGALETCEIRLKNQQDCVRFWVNILNFDAPNINDFIARG